MALLKQHYTDKGMAMRDYSIAIQIPLYTSYSLTKQSVIFIETPCVQQNPLYSS